MNKKGRGLEINEIVEKGEVIVWAIIVILAIWLLVKFLFK
jgi:hypothetical protein